VATVAVGLKPGKMTKLERQLFGSRIKDYLRSRYATMSSIFSSTVLFSNSRWHHRLCMESMYLQPVRPSFCRDKILVKWYEDCTHAVDLHQLLGELPRGLTTAWPTPAQGPRTHHGLCTVVPFVCGPCSPLQARPAASKACCKQGLLQARPGVHGVHGMARSNDMT